MASARPRPAVMTLTERAEALTAIMEMATHSGMGAPVTERDSKHH